MRFIAAVLVVAVTVDGFRHEEGDVNSLKMSKIKEQVHKFMSNGNKYEMKNYYGITRYWIEADGVMWSLPTPLGNRQYVASGRYRLHYDARSWQDAKEQCVREGGKLAVPKSEDEFNLIQSLVRKMRFPNIQGWNGIPLAWLGVSNLDDYRTWRTVDGEDFKNTGFSTSWKHSEDPAEPHCAGADAVFRGLRVHWCHLKQPYVCEHDNTLN